MAKICLNDWKSRRCRGGCCGAHRPGASVARCSPVARFGIIELNELAKRKSRMIVLKAPQDQVLAALQAISGLIERRHTMPLLDRLIVERRLRSSSYEAYVQLRRIQPMLTRLLPMLPPLVPEIARPPIKVALGRVRELRGFFGATKVNARNAP
jgi:hypothetical protein